MSRVSSDRYKSVIKVPIRRSFGLYYDDDMERLERIKVQL